MNRFNKHIIVTYTLFWLSSCVPLKQSYREPQPQLPDSFSKPYDSVSMATIQWRNYFKDNYLTALIDTALINNQELNIVLQKIEREKNEILARKGEYLPAVDLGAGAGLEKPGKYTRDGAVEEQLNIREEQKFPEPLGDVVAGVNASWEVDIWKKLRNAKNAAVNRYLASIEGKKFLVTQLVAEIAENYYELMAMDNLLKIINENIIIQTNALRSVKQQKEAARATQLAVNRFEALLLKTQNLQYEVKQRIAEAENRIIFLTGKIQSKIERNSDSFLTLNFLYANSGVPSELLVNRPDIKQAEWELKAAKLDVKSAKANFYPSLTIKAGLGFNAFNPQFLINPQSLLYNAAGELMAPFINRNAIKALYYNANAKQIQAVLEYEKAILNGFTDVQNQLAKVENYTASFDVKLKEVKILEQSVTIANSLFNSARADYVEVLLTQEEVLNAKMEMVEIKAKQIAANINLYRSLGGGWN